MTYFDDEAARRMEAMYATQGVVHRRRAVVAALEVKAGERVVDIGTGAGFVAYDIADAIGATGRGGRRGYQRTNDAVRKAAVRRQTLGTL